MADQHRSGQQSGDAPNAMEFFCKAAATPTPTPTPTAMPTPRTYANAKVSPLAGTAPVTSRSG
jgi:hypothetical protein